MMKENVQNVKKISSKTNFLKIYRLKMDIDLCVYVVVGNIIIKTEIDY